MPTLTLPRPLLALALHDSYTRFSGRSVGLAATDWPELVREIRRRYPMLAEQVIDQHDGIRRGFLLVINGNVIVDGNHPERLAETDEVSFVAQISGG